MERPGVRVICARHLRPDRWEPSAYDGVWRSLACKFDYQISLFKKLVNGKTRYLILILGCASADASADITADKYSGNGAIIGF